MSGYPSSRNILTSVFIRGRIDAMGIGNKAESLVKLADWGFLVPQFSVVTSDVFLQLCHSSMQASQRRVLLSQWLEGRIRIDPAKTYAVRSSGNKEDSSSASFAGLFSTYLDVVGTDQIIEAIIKCWDAVKSERVVAYCQQKNIDPKSLQMSVIVQEYITGDFSGVVFTMNPQTGHEDEVIVELVSGSGEKLVSGQVNPDFFEITFAEGGMQIRRERKDQNIFSSVDHRDLFLKHLLEKSKAIQSKFHSPQDIEFTVKSGEIYFLQSRPITFFDYAQFDSVWTTADFRDGGVSSAVVSPVMWSLYGNVFSHSMESYFRHLGLLASFPKEKLKWFRVLYGKPYWNVELVKQVQLQLPGFREDTFDQDLSIPPVYQGRGRQSGWSLGKIIKAIPVLFRISAGFSVQEKIALRWMKEFPTYEKQWLNRPWDQLGDSELLACSKELCSQQFQLESDYFTTIYNASNAKMFFLETLTALQTKIDGLNYTELIKNIDHLSVLSPLNALQEIAAKIQSDPDLQDKIVNIIEDSISAEEKHQQIVKELGSKNELAKMIQVFFEKYYHHSTKELDLRVPRWGEEKSFFYSTLKTTLLNPISYRKVDVTSPSLEKLEKHFQENILDRLVYRQSFHKRLKRLKKFLWLREEVRDRSTRMYYFVRQWLLFLNRKFQVNDMFFCLSVEDIFAYLEFPEKRQEIQQRAQYIKSYAAGFESFRNPNEVGLKLMASRTGIVHNDGKTLMGIACSPGRVRGRVRVLKSIQESQTLRQGEIMVVPYTDPGWTPLFGLSAGVITETGGLLSHAALIAREYSIPAVLNIPDATEKLKTGMQIELDGSLGHILILSDV
ncbi:MAG: hypothetical protein JNL11_06525 [Bdellovibrionaceae bacterium]|nr:hypothetical protein [Pseudobdellovibrionaceae bacterium]